jgi:type IV pilus assembly protein PilN
MRIILNLATRPYADLGPALKRLRIGMAALAVVLALLGLGLMHFHQRALRMAAQEAIVDESIARIQHEQSGYQVQMQQPANAKVLTQAQFLNQLFDEKAFSWTAAMEDLERVLPGGVQVTALEPARGKDGRLTLRLRTSGLRERSVELVRNMERSRRFANPRVSGENAENSGSQGGFQQVGDPNKVSFEILAEYSPATLEERKAELAGQKKHPEAGTAVSTHNPPKPASGPRPDARPGPRSGLRPGYVPPNPQPQRQIPPRPGLPPGASQFQNPMRGPNRGPVQGSIPDPNQNQETPSGYDPNGLKNHDRNRIPPPGTQPPGAPQENPQ